MRVVLYLLANFFLVLSCYLFSNKSNYEIKAIAKFISYEGGDKVHTSKYLILLDLNDSNKFENDTISVAFYNYTYSDSINRLDTVLLTLDKYKSHKSYFLCPKYDVKMGIEKAKIENISFEFWRECEENSSNCIPLRFTRKHSDKNWFLFMPSGGTQTSITVTCDDNSYRNSKNYTIGIDGAPFLELSNLKDGKYNASMTACGLSGNVKFNLISK